MIPDYSKAHILVAGDVMLDEYWLGTATRISPEAPAPVVRVESRDYRPGGAANVACNLAGLGAQVTLLGIVGKDDEAEALDAAMRGAGVTCEWLHSESRPTVRKLRVLSRNQQVIRLDRETPFGADDASRLMVRYAELLAGCSAVVLSDYAKGSLADAGTLIEAARAGGTPVLVDPKSTDFGTYRGAGLLTPNRAEFEAALGGSGETPEEMASRAQRVCSLLEIGSMVVTLGDQGLLVAPAAGPSRHMPARTREVYDVTGAGDTVTAVLAAGLAVGAELEDSAHLANVAAGVVVRRVGVAPIRLRDLAEELREPGTAGSAIVDAAEAAAIGRRLRDSGRTLVMTNGCFDLLHAGHTACLAEARALGDRLMVAVNDDQSVRRLKGGSRPLVPLDQRMAVLAALGSVDWVVPFGEDTPAALIEEVGPLVLAKGGDYKPEEIAGGDAVERLGGRVVVLPYRDGLSTTTLLERLTRE
ncbi:MAG: bifunctional D-glycero-beta-D-manno-heptose-7-phosphate kinase/D-glycero-beta-D-manno-heptose 1-phosphate adenylyltransferase HldE [Gammaproteobacteria bacterium]|nr:bifunctional D-glycero-beta-D-manno-heptose-7-phosphate kinase/D-glycero-beta-D-manno-heptose 1-phosphate adenylyltransferase HldE [Gammaproteobacteria bacterium]MYF66382.1 bifunctional D-glycero-beta-D-manno-heptose-7-phosphate kinase/D-glycero-beta-D-manno-heptose 1-phosphate adenylyltransferase HldE [Gammaproteobacteria bacterium]MYK37253.1 bifunctional D-glycero-beta-D-manno-heptose-7-phosphate kinase/D-glycero-beta-D-manno-heptose 1-phosphate adenylyltransferase HldE [Gammaproteobacteria 